MEWRCACGFEAQETGDRKGYGVVQRHVTEQRRLGAPTDEHKILGLFDGDELLVKGPNMRLAMRLGYVQPKEGPAHEEEAALVGQPHRKGSPVRVQTKFITVEVDPALYILYELAKAMFPEDYGEATFAEWIEDCVIGFYADHPELGFDVLFRHRPEVRDYCGRCGNAE